jgi:hypothetical protein
MILVDAIAPRLLQLSLDSLDRRAAAPSSRCVEKAKNTRLNSRI